MVQKAQRDLYTGHSSLGRGGFMKVSLCLVLLMSAAAVAGELPRIPFTDTRLPNGLRVIISEDHYAPVYSIAVSYNVGSRDEHPGHTGFAHLFEHMMFKGSEHVGAGEHFYLVFNNGGNMNGTTDNDRTLYFEELPRNQLDLGLFLEADRMRSLAITQANLDNQRQAVEEERRLSVDNRPYGRTDIVENELVYKNFAYSHPVIGSMKDLDAASVDDVRAFFRTYYAPNNATLALVGDLDTAETLAKVKKYFGDIPRQPAPKPVDLSEPPQTGEQHATVEDKLARLTALDVIYRTPPTMDKDSVAIGILNSILAGGESSRLYQRLVKEKQSVVQVEGYRDSRVGPSFYEISAILRPGKTVEEVQAVIDEEVAKLQNEPVSADELLKARNTARRNAINERETTLYRAVELADDATLFNDPDRVNTLLDQELAVTAADVERVAKLYLKPANRTVVVTVPAGSAPKSATGKGE
jgi:zinc protease